MNLEQLQQKLLTAARAHPPDDRVPYAFEKRILAHLSGISRIDHESFWARALWRAAAPCVALTLLLSAWSFIGTNNPATTDNEAFSQRFEQIMLAAVDDSEEAW
jgi:hypothetical protein